MSTKERIPRPPNCFILFRTEMRKLCNDSAERSRSSFTSKLWNEMSEDEKKPWREKARIKKEEVEEMECKECVVRQSTYT